MQKLEQTFAEACDEAINEMSTFIQYVSVKSYHFSCLDRINQVYSVFDQRPDGLLQGLYRCHQGASSGSLTGIKVVLQLAFCFY